MINKIVHKMFMCFKSACIRVADPKARGTDFTFEDEDLWSQIAHLEEIKLSPLVGPHQRGGRHAESFGSSNHARDLVSLMHAFCLIRWPCCRRANRVVVSRKLA